MQNPYLSIVDNFDALKEYTFNFTYLGSNRITKNEMEIREDRQGGQPIYARESTKFEKEHVLPAGTLTNGKRYRARIRVDIGNSWSDWSPEISFLCLKTPHLAWDSLDDKNYVYNNDIMMTVLFYQEQGEKVEQYQFSLLDHNKNRVSNVSFPWRKPDLKRPNILTERLENLTKGRLYHVGVRIQTKNGISHYETHELIPHYVTPTVDGVIEVKNQDEFGSVLIQTYLKQMLGTAIKPYIINAPDDNATRYTYFKNEWVIIPKERPLLYENLGMAKASDWVLKSKQQNVSNGLMFDFSEKLYSGIHIKFYKYDDYIAIEKEYNGIKSRTRSNIINNLGKKAFTMYVKVKEHRIECHIELTGGG